MSKKDKANLKNKNGDNQPNNTKKESLGPNTDR